MTESALAVRAARPVDARGASWRAIYIIWYRDVLRYWRDRWRLMASLAQPLLFLIVFGTGLSSSLRGATGSFGGSSAGSVQYVQFIYPGIVAMAVLFTSMFSAMSIVWDREFGFLKEVLVAPINRAAVAVGKTLGGTTQALVQGLVLLLLAPFVGVRLNALSVLELLPLIAVLAFALSAMGVAVASRMRSMQSFGVVMNFLMMPIFFLSGALFPLNGLPGWMTVLTRLDPATYGVDPIRQVVLAGSGVPSSLLQRFGVTVFDRTLTPPAEVALLAAFGIAMLAIAIANFRQRE